MSQLEKIHLSSDTPLYRPRCGAKGVSISSMTTTKRFITCKKCIRIANLPVFELDEYGHKVKTDTHEWDQEIE